jgi:hypothetical protein
MKNNIICTKCNLNEAERIICHKQVNGFGEDYRYEIVIEDYCQKCRWNEIIEAGIRLGSLKRVK